MWKFLAYSVLACGVVVLGVFNKVVSKGRWLVDKTERCPDHEKYPYDIDLLMRKINDTHDAFSGEMELLEDITEDGFGIILEACKKTELGCNTVAVLEDESLCQFFIKRAEENFKEVLRNYGVEEHCPMRKGFYKLNDYIFDNREFPEKGMCGSFKGTVIVTKHDEKTKSDLQMACFIVHVHFDEEQKGDELKLV